MRLPLLLRHFRRERHCACAEADEQPQEDPPEVPGEREHLVGGLGGTASCGAGAADLISHPPQDQACVVGGKCTTKVL